MSKEVSLANQVEGRAAIRDLNRELQALPLGAQEVDRREDSANDIALLLVSQEVLLVTVTPRDDSLPFQFEVSRAEAKEAYIHPYAFLGRVATATAA